MTASEFNQLQEITKNCEKQLKTAGCSKEVLGSCGSTPAEIILLSDEDSEMEEILEKLSAEGLEYKHMQFERYYAKCFNACKNSIDRASIVISAIGKEKNVKNILALSCYAIDSGLSVLFLQVNENKKISERFLKVILREPQKFFDFSITNRDDKELFSRMKNYIKNAKKQEKQKRVLVNFYQELQSFTISIHFKELL